MALVRFAACCPIPLVLTKWVESLNIHLILPHAQLRLEHIVDRETTRYSGSKGAIYMHT